MTVYKTLDEATKQLRAGAVGVLPSDTQYGLMACANQKEAVARIYELKGRTGQPGTLIAGSVEQLVELGMKARYLKVVSHYWPNPISIVIPCHELEYLHLGLGGVAVRIPADETLRAFLMQTGPLQTSSANITGQPPATTIKEAREYFGDKVEFYVDGGDLSGHPPSTVIRVVDDAVEVLREGAVDINSSGEIK